MCDFNLPEVSSSGWPRPEPSESASVLRDQILYPKQKQIHILSQSYQYSIQVIKYNNRVASTVWDEW